MGLELHTWRKVVAIFEDDAGTAMTGSDMNACATYAVDRRLAGTSCVVFRLLFDDCNAKAA